MVVNGLYSGLTSCLGSDKADCTTNSIMSVVMAILVIIWFAFLSAMAYAAWIRRTTTLILLFIMLEIITTGVSAFGLTHYDNFLGQITSLIDFLAGLWVLIMGYYLFKLRGTTPPPSSGRRRSKINQF